MDTKRIIPLFLAMLLAAYGVVSQAHAANYYVDHDGAAGNGTIGSPWNNLDDSLNSNGAVEPGDTVYIKGNTTRSLWLFTTGDGGSAGNVITYTVWPGEADPVISCGGATTPCVGVSDGIGYITFDSLRITNAYTPMNILGDNITVQNCEIDGSTRFQNVAIGSDTARATNVTLTGNTIRDGAYAGYWSHGVYVINADTTVLSGNDIYGNDGNAIQVQAKASKSTTVDTTTIKANKLHDNGKAGLVIREQSCVADVTTGTVAYNNQIWDNAENGIEICQPNLLLYNNTVWSNTENCIEVQANAAFTAKNNICYANLRGVRFATYNVILAETILCDKNIFEDISSSHIDIVSGGELATWEACNTMAGNPLFLSTNSGVSDFLKIDPSSPAYEAGTDVSATVTDDYFGTSRPQGAALEMGMHEVTGVAAISGSVISGGLTEAQVTAGSEEIVIVISGAEWVAAGATFNAQRQLILDNIVAGDGAGGWDLEWAGKEGVAAVVRTNATTVTITMSSQAAIGGSFNITGDISVTVTIVATAHTGSGSIVASPTITVSATLAASSTVTGGYNADGATWTPESTGATISGN